MPRIFPHLTATPLQAATYLLGIALFSIAFLVFLNSSISFIITDVIGQEDAVGDATGTLGFADELLALVACPLWGLVSDRIGVRTVAVTGYCIVGLSLVGLVQSKNVYPELLFARLAFSVGGAACSTMVTAVLPSMVAQRVEVGAGGGVEDAGLLESSAGVRDGHAARLRAEEREARRDSLGHGPTPSMSSEVTITPTRYTSRSRTRQLQQQQQQARQATTTAEAEPKDPNFVDKTAPTSHLAGLVGLFTGAGALLALACFLPLPALFQRKGQSPAESLETTYYLVASIAFLVAICIFIGLRRLPGEETKTLTALFDRPYDESTHIDEDGNLHTTLTPTPSYFSLVSTALKLGVTEPAIFLAYLAGFVARASSVAISLFIPLFINAYFKRTGLCKPDHPSYTSPDSPSLPDIKKNCERAYILASALSGIAETAALLCAPIFGWLGAKYNPSMPLLVAALAGVGGYVGFGLVKDPDVFHPKEGDGGGKWAFLAVVAVGISQIGAIVCSLGLLGRGINSSSGEPTPSKAAEDVAEGSSQDAPGAATSSTAWHTDITTAVEAETTPLLPPPAQPSHAKPTPSPHRQQKGRHPPPPPFARERLKGSIAGIYSFAGGAGILLLTKLGGKLFDVWTEGAPFFLMAAFNGVLGVAIAGVSAWGLRAKGKGSEGEVARSRVV